MTSERYCMSLIKAEGLFQRHNPSKATHLGNADRKRPATDGQAANYILEFAPSNPYYPW